MTRPHSTSGRRSSKDTVCYIRQIKVNQQHYPYRLKDEDYSGAGRAVPWIQMKGYWLQRAGFDIDSPVKIRVMQGCLVLTVE